MQAPEAQRAVAAATAVVSELGLPVDGAEVLSDSNRLVARLGPCDVIARVAPPSALAPVAARSSWLSGPDYHARLVTEVDVVRRLADGGGPVAGPEPRVEPRLFAHDGFAVSLWAPHEPVRRMLPPARYARTLADLHAGLRQVDVPVPHVMDRIEATRRDVASRDVTPDLADEDRALLADTLADLCRSVVGRGTSEQLLHGEPHLWNVLDTEGAPLFMDFEDIVRGPVEWDLAWVPKEVIRRYPEVDRELVEDYRGVVLAIIVAHRWSHDDQHPSGRRSGVDLLERLRGGPPWRLPI